MKRIQALFIVLLLLLTGLAGCGDNQTDLSADADSDEINNQDVGPLTPKNGENLVIGYSAIATFLAPWSNCLAENMQKECDEQGWDLISLSAEGDVDVQTEQIYELIKKDPDIIVLFAGDQDAAVDWVKEISAAGIPCIMLAMNVDEEGQKYVNAYVGPDQSAMCQDIAKYIIDKNGADARLNIVSISGVPVQDDYILRLAGFKAGIAATNYNFHEPEYAYSSSDDAKTYMESFIDTYGEYIDVFMGFDDTLTMGAIEAIDEAGMTGKVQVYSITGQSDALEAIREGKMEMTVMNRTDEIVSRCSDVIQMMIEGQSFDYYQETPVHQITINNIDQYEPEF